MFLLLENDYISDQWMKQSSPTWFSWLKKYLYPCDLTFNER